MVPSPDSFLRDEMDEPEDIHTVGPQHVGFAVSEDDDFDCPFDTEDPPDPLGLVPTQEKPGKRGAR